MRSLLLSIIGLIFIGNVNATNITGQFTSVKNNDTLVMNSNITGNVTITHTGNLLITNGYTINGNLAVRGNFFRMVEGVVNGQGKAVTITNCNNVIFQSVDIITSGENAQCVNIPGGYSGTYNIVFDGGVWDNRSTSFNSRESYDGAVFWSGSFPRVNPVSEYDVIIQNVTVKNGPCQGIIVKGKFLIRNCAITTDATNIKWDSVYLYKGKQSPIGQSADNSYLILCRGAEPGTIISNNQLISGDLRGGSRGIMLENCAGTQSQPIQIFGNVGYIHAGPSGENLGGVTRVIRMRNIDGGKTSYVYVYNNTFTSMCDNDPNTTAYGSDAVGANFGFPNTSDTCKVFGNKFHNPSRTAGTNNKAFECTYGGTAPFPHLIADNEFYSSEKIGQFLDEYNGIPCSNIKLDRNTFGFINDFYVSPNRVAFVIGYSGKTSLDNIISNSKFVGGASETVKYYHTNGVGEIFFKKDVHVVVKEGALLVNAVAWVKDKYRTYPQQNINGSGKLSANYLYRSNTGDSIYNPMVYVEYNGRVDSAQLYDSVVFNFQPAVDNSPTVQVFVPEEAYNTDSIEVVVQCQDDKGLSFLQVGNTTLNISGTSYRHSYKTIYTPGNHIIDVIVADSKGQTATAVKTVKVLLDNAPIVVISSLDTIIQNSILGVDFICTDDRNLQFLSVIVDTTYSYFISGGNYSVHLDIPVTRAGVFSVAAEVIDNRGQVTIITKQVVVKPEFQEAVLNGVLNIDGVDYIFENTKVKKK